jgi:hypothetical protein
LHDLDDVEIEQPLFAGPTPRSIMGTPSTNSNADEYRRSGLAGQLLL